MIRSFSLLIIFFYSYTLAAQDLVKEIQNHFPPFQNGPWESFERPPQPRTLYPGLFAHSAPVKESYSSKAHAFAGVENGALYLRMEDSEETKLLAEPNAGWRWDVEAAKWSEDGSYMLVRQIDDRMVKRAAMRDENGREYLKEYSYVGEPLEIHQYYIVNTVNGKSVLVAHGDDMPYVHAVGWTQGRAFLLRADRLLKKLELLAIDQETGEPSVVISESSDTYLVGLNLLQHYDRRLDRSGLVTLLNDRIIWASERSGFRQLYLYTTEGQFIRQLSNVDAPGVMMRIFGVTEAHAYYLARKVEVGNTDHPYRDFLVRASLGNEGEVVLLEQPAILETIWAEDNSRFWVLSGSMEQLSIKEFDVGSGHSKTYWEHDYSFLKEGGFAPEYVWTKVPDDTLRIGTAILKPKDFDPDKKYPVVEYIYGGPYNMLPWNPLDRGVLSMQDFANKGYIVVYTDSRGTEYRGKAFNDYEYGRLGQVQIPDHAFILEKLCKERKYMDRSRVGIMGHSMGGYFSLRAMVMQPDLYSAGYLLAANVDPVKFRVWAEPFYGCMPHDCPERYAAASVTDRLDKLSGPVMISHGTNDQHIPVSEAYRLMEAMDNAGYDQYEFVLYEGVNHQLFGDGRWYTNMVSFFERVLKGGR